MKVNRQQLLEHGFLILREVIPPDQLDELRASYEVLIERQGGQSWLSKGAQPRLSVSPLIDEATANAVEIWLHENTLGVSRQLLCLPEAAVTSMWMMCSPLQDHGPANWHRDVHPIDMAPMHSLQVDMLENGPRYLQWNIPLYDDDVLWVVPGSHRRLNTEEENRQLLENPRVPLPNGTPVELKAGDAVVYINYIMHWGSNYSAKLRRTLHGGHSIFTDYPDLNFTRFLSSQARDTFAAWSQRSVKMQDVTESALRAAINADVPAYHAALEALQPGAGENGKMVLTIYLSKAAYHIHLLKDPDADNLPPEVLRRASGLHSITINWGPEFANRFSQADADVLWQRFKTLDAKLQSDTEHFVPGYQSGPMRYFFDEMPADFGPEDFIASWGT